MEKNGPDGSGHSNFAKGFAKAKGCFDGGKAVFVAIDTSEVLPSKPTLLGTEGRHQGHRLGVIDIYIYNIACHVMSQTRAPTIIL